MLDFEIYGAGSLHFLAQACHVEETGEEIEIDKDSCTSVFIVKCDVLGQIGYIDEVSCLYLYLSLFYRFLLLTLPIFLFKFLLNELSE